MKIFDIKQEFAELNRLIEEESESVDPETGEFINNTDTINDLLDELTQKKGDLLDFLADKRLEARGAIDIFSEKIKQLQERKKTLENKEKRLLDTIDFVLEGEKFKSDEHTFYYQKTVSVEVLNESDIDARFIEFKPSINKAELKKALQAGEHVNGAELKENIGVRIR